MTRCWFVDDHRADHAVTTLCRLVELPRGRPTTAGPRPLLLGDAYLANEIVDIYRQSRSTFGSPRVWAQLRRAGIRVGEKRAARIMAELGLVGAHSRKKWRRGANSAPAGDLLAGFTRRIERARAERKTAELRLRQATTGTGLTEAEIREAAGSLADAISLLPAASPEDRRRVYEAAQLEVLYDHEGRRAQLSVAPRVSGGVGGGT